MTRRDIKIKINKDDFKKKLGIKDGVDYVLTEADKKEIGQNIKIPIVEKIIEKIEVIRETPIITNEVREVAVTDTPDEVVEKVNEANKKIKAKQIEGLTKALKIVDEYGTNPQGYAFGGANQTVILDEGTRITEHFTELNFTGAGVSATYGNSGRINVDIGGSVTPVTPGGSDTQVQFNDSGVLAGDAGLTYNKTTDMLSAGGLTATGGAVLEKVVTLTDGATVALNAALGNVFNLTAGGNRTILAPDNPKDGQRIIINILASGANRTITLTKGADAFVFSSYVASLPIILSGKVLSVVARYSSLNSRWIVLAENADV